MVFWIFMTLMNALVPCVILGFGYYFKNHIPNHISYIYGYRTPRSVKNMETWTFAHQKLSEVWMKLGWYLLAPSVLLMLPFISAGTDSVAIISSTIIMIQCVIMIGSIFVVESALKRNFDKDGNRIHYE